MQYLFIILISIFCGCQTVLMPEEDSASVYQSETMMVAPDVKHSQPFDNEPSMREDDYPMELTIQAPFPEPRSRQLLQRSTPSFSEYPKISQEQKAMDEALEFCETSQEYWQKGELDEAIDALDQAYQLILSIDTDAPALFQQKEDLRFMISKRILEIYASRNIVVTGTHEAIPVILNEHVKREIKRFTGVERSFFESSYRRSGKYRPMILRELKKAGLPEALSWLPLIESGFKVKALSHARALGLWQFIPSTGYKFGLKRTRFIDERMDPYKATIAAIAYLKELHRIFGDWTTVLAAYNCGEGRVLRTIKRQNINYLDNFWDLYDRLPRETSRYVPRFLATLYVIGHMKQCGFNESIVDHPPQIELVEINRQVHLKNIAARLGLQSRNLYELNPELRYHLLPDEPYMLKVPIGKRQKLLSCIDNISISGISKGKRTRTRYHRVRRGETLSNIAKRYGVSVYSIKSANRLRGNQIIAGKTIKIPGSSSKKYRAKKSSRSHHRVRRGESLSSIASLYGISVNDLKRANGLRGNTIHVGDNLKISTQRKSNRKKFQPSENQKTRYSVVTHRVKKGDSLWNIARKYNTNTKSIVRQNNLSSTQLKIGQRLKIPVTVSARKSGHHKYRVKSGDSPFQIATKHNMSLADFLRLNRLSPGSKIFPGQLVYVE